MRNSDDQKPQYVDLSYGWQDRSESAKDRQRKRRWWRFLLAGLVSLPVVAYLVWRLV